MSVSYIPPTVKMRLWGKAAGRCEYAGCNQPLWRDELTQAEFNTAYIAHIVADKPDGPRGHPVLSEELKADISNLMLLCDVHHRKVDIAEKDKHSRELLEEMKEAHERRVEIVAGIQARRQTEILLYGANVGAHAAPVSYESAAVAVVPDRYPADARGIALGMRGSMTQDRDPSYWETEGEQLRRAYEQQVAPRLADGSVEHISLFALAPQPLLMMLGSLLSDIPGVDVFQLHREPKGWRWPNDGDVQTLEVEQPPSTSGTPALVLAISAPVVSERIEATLGPDRAIWRITVPDPHNDVLRTRGMLEQFRVTARRVLEQIKLAHGERATLHVFPAVPVSVAVELGRVWMPKAHLPMWVYDEQKERGGFVRALSLGAVDRDPGDRDA